MARTPEKPDAPDGKKPSIEEIRTALGKWGGFLDNDILGKIVQQATERDHVQGIVEVKSARFKDTHEDGFKKHVDKEKKIVARQPVAFMDPAATATQQRDQNTVRRDETNIEQQRSSSETIIKRAILGEYIYSTIALILGLSAIIGGSILCIYGVAGHTSFTASVLGLNTNFNDAAPGVVLFVVGLFMIWVTRPKVKLGDLIG
jgi:hypothetical protein